jgi:glycine/D-amino acid oxidase-like deaminating enzyme
VEHGALKHAAVQAGTAGAQGPATPGCPGRRHAVAGTIERLQTLCGRLSPALNEEKIVAWQACYRPIKQDGLPLIGKEAV